MSRNVNFGLYAAAVAIAVVGALWVGVPVGALLLLAVALVCPLMMMFMMHGMHGDGDHRTPDRATVIPTSTCDTSRPWRA